MSTSSSAGRFGNLGQTVFGAAKMGPVGFTQVLAVKGAKHGILANAITPLSRNTRMTQNLMGEDAPARDKSAQIVTPPPTKFLRARPRNRRCSPRRSFRRFASRVHPRLPSYAVGSGELSRNRVRSVESVSAVTHFNAAINSACISDLALLMSEDHCFIDSAGASLAGREPCLDAWKQFFAAFPDYRNVFIEMKANGAEVAVRGHSVCSTAELDGPALWSAHVRDGLVTQWRVYPDTPDTRTELGLN